jgi:hypothetical protein
MRCSIIGVLVLAMLRVPAVSSVAASPFPGEPLHCLDARAVETIRSEPEELRQEFEICRPELEQRLAGLQLAERGHRAAFATIAAHAMAPYANSRVFDLPSLLREPGMDCDNYAALVGHFFRILIPAEPNGFAVAGFVGGAVGNHAQIFFSLSGEPPLLGDPTIGLVAAEGFDDLLSGKPVPPERIFVAHMHEDKLIDAFGDRVFAAIEGGRYRPSDLLYYFDSMDRFISFSMKLDSLMARRPRPIQEIMGLFPTPAAASLEKSLATVASGTAE